MATLSLKIENIDKLNDKINEVIEKANALKQAVQEFQEIELRMVSDTDEVVSKTKSRLINIQW